MQITRVVTDSVKPRDSGICGEFSIYLDNEICIHKMKVINGEKGLFVAFPNTGEASTGTNGKRFFDVVHPINNSLRQIIQDKVLEKYHEELQKQ